MKMRFCVVQAIAFVAGVQLAVAETVWHEGFEDAAAVSRWHAARGFNIVDGEGVDGGRCLLWEESRIRPVSAKSSVAAVAEDNAVRPAPPSGGVDFIREFPVEPGRKYEFSVKVKGAITNNCAYVFFRWYDRDGKVLGRSEARPTIYKQVGRKGWETVKASSQRLPSDAAKGEIYVQLYRTTLGRMAFDDFEVACDEPRHVERMFSSAYRDEAAEGKVKFVVPYVASRNRFPPESLSGSFSFVGEKGGLTIPADTMLADRFEVSLDVSRLAMGRHPARAVLRHGDDVLGECEMEFSRLAARTPRKVRFNERQRLMVDDRPFFPIGVYVHPADKEVKYLDRLKGGPFNCVIECSADRRMLDKFHAIGLKVLPKAPWNPKWARSAAKDLRGHPAILAWYVIDEAPADRADEKRALQKVLEDADPDHPTFAVLAVPGNSDAFMGAFDIIAADPYPIGYRRNPISTASTYPGICRKKTYGIRPVWQVPQSFAWDWCHKHGHPAEDRYPTYDELRSMTWQAIAGGANGLLWYSAHHIFKCSPPEELESNWGNLVKVAEEVKARVDLLLSDENPPEVSIQGGAIAARAFRHNGRTWLLATNTTYNPAHGVVSVESYGKVSLALAPLGVEFREVSAK